MGQQQVHMTSTLLLKSHDNKTHRIKDCNIIVWVQVWNQKAAHLEFVRYKQACFMGNLLSGSECNCFHGTSRLTWLSDIDFRYAAIMFTKQILHLDPAAAHLSLPLPASAIIVASRWHQIICFMLLVVDLDAIKPKLSLAPLMCLSVHVFIFQLQYGGWGVLVEK